MKKSEHFYIAFCIAYAIVSISILANWWEMDTLSHIMLSLTAIMFVIADMLRQWLAYIGDLWKFNADFPCKEDKNSEFIQVKDLLTEVQSGIEKNKLLTIKDWIEQRLPEDPDQAQKARVAFEMRESIRDILIVTGIVSAILAIFIGNLSIPITVWVARGGDAAAIIAFIFIFIGYTQKSLLDKRKNLLNEIRGVITGFRKKRQEDKKKPTPDIYSE